MYHFQNISDQEHTHNSNLGLTRYGANFGYYVSIFLLDWVVLRSSSSTTKELHEAATQAKSYQELCEQSQHLKRVKSL